MKEWRWCIDGRIGDEYARYARRTNTKAAIPRLGRGNMCVGVYGQACLGKGWSLKKTSELVIFIYLRLIVYLFIMNAVLVFMFHSISK